MKMLNFEISAEDDGAILLNLLKKKFDFSSTLINKLKRRNGAVMLDGIASKLQIPIKAGSNVSIDISDYDMINPYAPVDLNIPIVFENDYYLILDKPAGIPIIPDYSHKDNSVGNFIAYYLGKNTGFHPVNRLDKGTSGLMMVAKCSYYHSVAKKQLHTDKFRREYLCIVHGKMEHQEGSIDLPIARSDDSPIKRIVAQVGKNALTEYKVVAENDTFSLLSVRLKTGRTHQIRVHFSHIGHPLAGDWLYGIEEKEIIGRPALHSSKISFYDTLSKKDCIFESVLPDDMKILL